MSRTTLVISLVAVFVACSGANSVGIGGGSDGGADAASPATAGTKPSWCFCRPVATCGSMPSFSNSAIASSLK